MECIALNTFNSEPFENFVPENERRFENKLALIVICFILVCLVIKFYEEEYKSKKENR
jgi:hypothetical protein